MDNVSTAFIAQELERQHTAELPSRDLLVAVTLFGLPLVGVSDVAVNVDTSGPNWLGSVGGV